MAISDEEANQVIAAIEQALPRKSLEGRPQWVTASAQPLGLMPQNNIYREASMSLLADFRAMSIAEADAILTGPGAKLEWQ